MTMLRKIVKAWSELLVYVFTGLGVLAEQLAPVLPTSSTIPVPKIGMVIFCAVVAFLLCFWDERSSGAKSPEAIQEGKRRTLRRRLTSAFTHGYTWQSLIPAALETLNHLKSF